MSQTVLSPGTSVNNLLIAESSDSAARIPQTRKMTPTTIKRRRRNFMVLQVIDYKRLKKTIAAAWATNK